MVPLLWNDLSQGFALKFPEAAAMTVVSRGKLSQSMAQKDKYSEASWGQSSDLFLNLFLRNALMSSHDPGCPGSATGGLQACNEGMCF